MPVTSAQQERRPLEELDDRSLPEPSVVAPLVPFRQSSLIGTWWPSALLVAVVALVALDAGGPVRAVLVVIALLVLPGLALLPSAGFADSWATAAAVICLSVTVETLVALLMLWTGVWYPRTGGLILLLLAVAAIWAKRRFPSAEALGSADPAAAPRRAYRRTARPVGGSAGPSAPHTSAVWELILDDGRHIEVSGQALFGRKPERGVGDELAMVVEVEDETRTVSKTHLSVSTNEHHVLVTDLGSTNGSTITQSDGLIEHCRPGVGTAGQEGCIVSFGAHWFEIRRGQRG